MIREIDRQTLALKVVLCAHVMRGVCIKVCACYRWKIEVLLLILIQLRDYYKFVSVCATQCSSNIIVRKTHFNVLFFQFVEYSSEKFRIFRWNFDIFDSIKMLQCICVGNRTTTIWVAWWGWWCNPRRTSISRRSRCVLYTCMNARLAEKNIARRRSRAQGEFHFVSYRRAATA